MKNSQTGLFRLIAIFKFVKAALLIVTAIGILKIMHTDVSALLDHWIARLGLDPGNHYVDLFMSKVANITPKRIEELGIGSFVYAALFLTEGIGLWLQKRWGEWFTVIITSSLVPFEVWEIVRHFSVGKILVSIANVAIVIYLVIQIRKKEPEPQTR